MSVDARWTGVDVGDWPPSSIAEAIRVARARLPQHLWDHAAGGANTEATLRRNREALERVLFEPRVLTGAARAPDVEAEVLGMTLRSPIMLAPVGPLELYAPGGALTAARAAHDAGVAAFVSTTSSPALDQVAAGTDGPLGFQLYVRGDRSWVADIVDRVERSGYRALCVTVDAPVYSRLERDVANRFVHSDHLELPNLPADRQAKGGLRQELAHQGSLTWDDLEWLCSITRLPVVVKGIMHPVDAQTAVDRGAQGIYVSNHGGRVLDHAPASIEVLAGVADAVGGRADVLVDSGFLHGEDVAKALALGADAVLIGKLQVWGLAAGGREGLARVLDLLREELLRALPKLGCGDVAQLEPSVVRRPTW